MPRILALEWDAREARVAVARTGARDVLVEHAFAVDLGPRDPGQTFADRNVGERIAAALAARDIGRSETLVAVGRASIELRRLSLPPSPEDELPELVRFQALRQFTGIGEDWALDFVHVDSGDDESLTVLAAAISPEMVGQIRDTCQAGELTPRHLVLRPFAAASLMRRRDRSGLQPCRLVVDLLADEADLTVMVDDQVALVRTVRVPETEAAPRALVGEIRRTIAAAHNQLRDRRVERVVLCGSGEEQAALQELLEKEFTHEVVCLDPFEGLKLSRELAGHKPEHPGRFAPLLGMLLDANAGSGHDIDFLNPRKKSGPRSRKRRNILIGATVAATVAALILLTWVQLASLDSDIAKLTYQRSRLVEDVEKAEEQRKEVMAIDGFLENDFSWLDELYDLSRELPSPDDVLITQINLSTRTPKGGQIVLEGYTRQHDHIDDLVRALRGKNRQVLTSGSNRDPRRDRYQWRFRETVVLEPQTASAPPAEEAGSDASAGSEEDDNKTAAASTPDRRPS